MKSPKLLLLIFGIFLAICLTTDAATVPVVSKTVASPSGCYNVYVPCASANVCYPSYLCPGACGYGMYGGYCTSTSCTCCCT
ncbi:hypothetical protein Bhyg_01683 [Pseudolycoriella hygida]|uniref:Uncharacterized protein n=1 Tax=Pseudolycoriella hygida TaxID=35572 RepID=A0A9Q0N9X0_9DIPT|nr:hypothetical protein Bhyg_01683 [Pseudolycoriella hygida]